MTDRMFDSTKMLLNKVLSIPGARIVTINVEYGTDSDDQSVVQSFDIDENNKIGYDPSHEAEFIGRLDDALAYGGGIVIRQFTKIKVNVDTPNGKMQIPIKKVYGIRCNDGSWNGLSAEEIELAERIDWETRELRPKEDAVIYCNLTQR